MCVCGSLILLIPTVRGTGNRKIGTDRAVAHSFKAAQNPARRAESLNTWLWVYWAASRSNRV
jgi:hypothetical protein